MIKNIIKVFTITIMVVLIVILGYYLFGKNKNKDGSSKDSISSLDISRYRSSIEVTISGILLDDEYTGSVVECQEGKNIKEGLSINIDSDETYCWDPEAINETIRQVSYSGKRITSLDIIVNADNTVELK